MLFEFFGGTVDPAKSAIMPCLSLSVCCRIVGRPGSILSPSGSGAVRGCHARASKNENSFMPSGCTLRPQTGSELLSV
jgi:hypothetical protein